MCTNRPLLPADCHNVHYRLSNEAADLLGCGERVSLYAAALIHTALLAGAGSRLARLAASATMAGQIADDETVDGLERFRARAAAALLIRAVAVESTRRVAADPIPYALTGLGMAVAL